MKLLQCKDIPTAPILQFLAQRAGKSWDAGGGWAFWYGPEIVGERSIANAMPPGTPDKVRIKKMAALIRRGLVSGCGCGCRGDYEITPKGEALLEASEASP